MLSKEEIEKAKQWLNWCKKEKAFLPYTSDILQYIDQLEQENKDLRFIQECDTDRIYQLEQENDTQNKIIDEMAEMLEELKIAYFKKEDGGELLGKYRCYNKEDWKQYFEKKVEKQNG